jgi:hypothetical protein
MHVWAEQGSGHMLHAEMRRDTGDKYKANDIPVWLTADLSLKRFLTVIECHYHWNKIDESFNVWHWRFFIGHLQWSLPSSTVEQMLIANDLSPDAIHQGAMSLNIIMTRRQHKIAKVLKRLCLLPHRKYKADQMCWAPWLGHSERDPIPYAGPGAMFDPWEEQIAADLAQNAEIVAHLANYHRVNLESLPTSIKCQRTFYDMAELTLETMLKLSEHTSLHDDVFVENWLDKQQFLGHSRQSMTDGTHIGPFITLLDRKPQIMTILALPTFSDQIVFVSIFRSPKTFAVLVPAQDLIHDERCMDAFRLLAIQVPEIHQDLPKWLNQAIKTWTSDRLQNTLEFFDIHAGRQISFAALWNTWSRFEMRTYRKSTNAWTPAYPFPQLRRYPKFDPGIMNAAYFEEVAFVACLQEMDGSDSE